jgi:hypothetical protein
MSFRNLEARNPFAEMATATAVSVHTAMDPDTMLEWHSKPTSDGRPGSTSGHLGRQPSADLNGPPPTLNYHNWQDICPEMKILKENIPTLLAEIKNVPHVRITYFLIDMLQVIVNWFCMYLL